MHPSAILTVLALAASTSASPTLLKTRQGFPSFRISNSRTYGNTCAVSNCIPIDYSNLVVESECGGTGCGAKPNGLTGSKEDVMCDIELDVCGRKVTLVSRADWDCKALGDLTSDDNGTGYATISENGNDVGTCTVNIDNVGDSQICGFAMGTRFTSLVDCQFK